MADVLELQRQHLVFAEEIFAFLLDNFKIESKCLKGYEFFRPYIGDAVLTISYIFRKDYWKIFNRLRGNLKHVKMFENYCKIVPVKKDERFFYYILMRISVIFELSMYCYDEGYDYFKKGWQCIAEYADLQFFGSSGGWGRLGHTALFIASLGQPLTLMTQMCSDQDEEKLTFDKVFNALDKHFILTGNLNMLDGAEMYFLTQINKMFKAQTQKTRKFKPKRRTEFTKNPNISLKAAAGDAKVSDRDLITEYFKKCFFDLVSSKALGYSIKNLEENMPNLSNVGTVKDYKDFAVLFESSDLRSASSDIALDFSNKKVVYIKHFKTSYQPTSIKCRRPYRLHKRKEITDIKVPAFIVPQKYLSFRNSDNSSKSMHLYSMKLYPPSTRKTLDEPMRKLLNENIDNHNYNTMPSGDIIVCPRVPLQSEDTLIIVAESSTDDEAEGDIDILTCLFKKVEMDSQGSESGYSLRPRQPNLLDKASSSDYSDESDTTTAERTESDNETPLKFYQRAHRKPGGSTRNETLPTEKLIRLYKKYFTSFLDVYFKRKFSPQLTEVQSCKSSANSKDSCGHVFAVTAGIMAKRKVLLDTPDETKRVLGVKLFETLRLVILPLTVQQALDSQIRRHNYFHTSNGIYGVGPKCTATKDIWVIFYSGNGRSNSLDFNHEDLKEIPKIYRSYFPVLEIFSGLPKEESKFFLDQIESSFRRMVYWGLQEDLILSVENPIVIDNPGLRHGELLQILDSEMPAYFNTNY